jgi:hypothetical protein
MLEIKKKIDGKMFTLYAVMYAERATKEAAQEIRNMGYYVRAILSYEKRGKRHKVSVWHLWYRKM